MAAKKSKKKSGKAAKPKSAGAKKAAKRARPGASRAAAKSAEGDLVYSDIRRTMHGAILRSLR